jgi:hypothetical protein
MVEAVNQITPTEVHRRVTAVSRRVHLSSSVTRWAFSSACGEAVVRADYTRYALVARAQSMEQGLPDNGRRRRRHHVRAVLEGRSPRCRSATGLGQRWCRRSVRPLRAVRENGPRVRPVCRDRPANR